MSELAELRRQLARFDDIEIDKFCLENFPTVYDRFSRGTQREEKFTLLLDHCRRRPEAMVRLKALLAEGVDAPEAAPAGRGIPSSHSSTLLPPGPVRARWALLVGVNQYIDPTFPPLRFCVNDVLALEGALQAAGYTVVTLHDGAPQEHYRPTRDNVEAELARLVQTAGPDDLIWVHCSCHGRLVNGRAMLVFRETRWPTLAERGLAVADLERRLRSGAARRLVLTLDACHTGVELGRAGPDPVFLKHVHERAEGYAMIAASTAQQIALEWQEKKQGVFTYFLLQGLQGAADRSKQGFVTVSDLANYTLDGLRRWSVEHAGMIQEPTARTEGLGAMILADYRKEGG